jgi:hypothetical protein
MSVINYSFLLYWRPRSFTRFSVFCFAFSASARFRFCLSRSWFCLIRFSVFCFAFKASARFRFCLSRSWFCLIRFSVFCFAFKASARFRFCLSCSCFDCCELAELVNPKKKAAIKNNKKIFFISYLLLKMDSECIPHSFLSGLGSYK